MHRLPSTLFAFLLALLLLPSVGLALSQEATVDGVTAYAGDITVRTFEEGYFTSVQRDEVTTEVLFRTQGNFPDTYLAGAGLLLVDSHSVIVRIAGEEELRFTIGDSNGGPNHLEGYDLTVVTTETDSNKPVLREMGATEFALYVQAIQARNHSGFLQTAFETLGGPPVAAACDFKGSRCSIATSSASCAAICTDGYVACCGVAATCECRSE